MSERIRTHNAAAERMGTGSDASDKRERTLELVRVSGRVAGKSVCECCANIITYNVAERERNETRTAEARLAVGAVAIVVIVFAFNYSGDAT